MSQICDRTGQSNITPKTNPEIVYLKYFFFLLIKLWIVDFPYLIYLHRFPSSPGGISRLNFFFIVALCKCRWCRWLFVYAVPLLIYIQGPQGGFADWFTYCVYKSNFHKLINCLQLKLDTLTVRLGIVISPSCSQSTCNAVCEDLTGEHILVPVECPVIGRSCLNISWCF